MFLFLSSLSKDPGAEVSGESVLRHDEKKLNFTIRRGELTVEGEPWRV